MQFLVKVSLIAILSISCLKIEAQTFAIKGGLNLANMLDYNNDTVFSDDYKIKPGIHFGFTANIPLNNYLSIESGIIVTNKGVQIEIVRQGNGYLGKLNLYYLEVPLTIRASHKLSDGKIIFGSAGPYISAGLIGKVKAITENNGKKVSAEDEVDFGTDQYEDEVRLLDWGLSFGGGIEVNEVVLGISYDLGLANIYPYQENGATLKNRVIKLSIGYIF
jgi:hypothetical protein